MIIDFEEAAEKLFGDRTVATTAQVARVVGLTEDECRGWALQLGVQKFGPSFAWTEQDVETLWDELDDEEPDDDDDEQGAEEDDEEAAEEEEDEEEEDD